MRELTREQEETLAGLGGKFLARYGNMITDLTQQQVTKVSKSRFKQGQVAIKISIEMDHNECKIVCTGSPDSNCEGTIEDRSGAPEVTNLVK